MREWLEVKFDIYTTAPLHVGTGQGAGLIDRTVMRDHDGYLYIPASTIKGKVREACEQLARLNHYTFCEGPTVEHQRCRDNPCIVCKLFGSTWHESGLYWDDAHLCEIDRKRLQTEKGTPAYQTEERTQARLSRARGVSQERALFTSEYGQRELRFESQVAGWVNLTSFLNEDTETNMWYEVLLLLGGLGLVSHLGSGATRGAGGCRISVQGEIKMNGQLLKPTDVLTKSNWEWAYVKYERAWEE